jgi:hypothetical protein
LIIYRIQLCEVLNILILILFIYNSCYAYYILKLNNIINFIVISKLK